MVKKLKCWKKSSRGKWHTTYSKPFSYDRASIYVIDWGPAGKYYQVITKGSKSKLSTKRFKKKSNANKFAQNWMRTHDKC